VTRPFRYLLRVRYSECDAQHVVFNAKYGEYFDLASTEFLRTALAPRTPFDGTFEFQVVRLLVEWTGPARADDVLEVSVEPKRFGTTSFTLGFEIRRRGEADAIVTGETVNVHAAMDPVSKVWAKAPLTVDMRRQLSEAARGKAVNHAGAGMEDAA
jgi:acyl-CoA thioester hydrolase